jgi:hypothetical protein
VPPAAKPAEDAQASMADLEAELKKAGWSKLTGKWKKTGPGIYEVTDGYAEADFVNGAVDVVLDSDTKGTVCLYARCTTQYKLGYGLIIRQGKFKAQALALDSTISGIYQVIHHGEPVVSLDLPITPLGKALHAGVSVNGQTIELTLNDKREHKSLYPRMSTDGSLRLVVHGTATIFNPRCVELK